MGFLTKELEVAIEDSDKFPSPLEVTGGSYLTEYGITLESVRFPYPLEVTRGSYPHI